jgi:hypothetical protein
VRTWALSAGLSIVVAGCSAVPVDPYAVPLDRLSEKHRAQVEPILADVAAKVDLEASDVRSRPEIYDFLLSEMPFTGGVVRELNRGKWEIFRDAKDPDPNVFHVVDKQGMRLRFELVHQEPTRRFYVSQGSYDLGLLGVLQGRTVIVMRAVPVGDVVRTDAVVYVRIDNAVFSTLAKGVRGMVESMVREKSGYFIRAARWVAEEASQRPDWLYTQVKESKEVDQAVLEDFRKRFLLH